MMVAMHDGTDLVYFANDHLSSASIVMNDTGGLLSQNRYMPFGEIRDNIASSPITQTDFGYTGQRNLASIGLMDYGARFYSPTLMRFIQPDSIIPNPQSPQSYNRYSYVINNPLFYIDPTGFKMYCADGRCSSNPFLGYGQDYLQMLGLREDLPYLDGIRPGNQGWDPPDYNDYKDSVEDDVGKEGDEGKSGTDSSVKTSTDYQKPIVELGPWEYGAFFSSSLKLGTDPWSVGYNKFSYGTSNSLGYFGFSFNGSGILALDVGILDIAHTAKYGNEDTSYGRGFSLRINTTTGPFLTTKGTGWTEEIRDYRFTANRLDMASQKNKVGFYARNKNVGTTAMVPYSVGAVGGVIAVGWEYFASAAAVPVLQKIPQFFK